MASLSLGFADEQQYPDIQPIGAPSDGLPTEAPGLDLADPTAGIGDTSALPIGRAAPQSRSLGLDPSVSARPQSDQDYLRSLSTGEKIGLMMQEFSAGVAGRPSPIDQVLRQKREKEARGMQELTNTITVLQKGSEILRKLPQGSLQRAAIAEQLGKAVGPKFAPVFAAAGSEQDDAIKNYLDVMGDAEVKQMAVKQCAQSADFQACILDLSLKDSWQKKAETVVDAKRLPALSTKMRAVADSMKASGKESFSLVDIEAANQGNALFTFEEMQTLRRNEAMFAPFGLKTKEVQKAGDIAREQARVKDENLTEKYDTGKTAHIPGKSGTFPARVSKIGATAGTIEIQGADGKWTVNPAARLISQPGVDKPPKPEREKAGEYTLPDGSTINHSQLIQQYKLENNLMDELDLRILSKTDPTRAASEREKVAKAMPFPRWAKQNFGIDVRGGASSVTAPTPAPKARLAMPAKKSELKVGQEYDTARGPAKWNGKAFEPIVD